MLVSIFVDNSLDDGSLWPEMRQLQFKEERGKVADCIFNDICKWKPQSNQICIHFFNLIDNQSNH